uniref:Nodule-specific cysteine-rich peptide L17 n=1 Tax=Lens culinaris TaxID=3864 RepID=A0A7T8IG02_LENCU|nr:nodule-specific cysteine-rich peptide L17 [Lens culinaris]
MAQILRLFYVLIIFVSLFTVVTNGNKIKDVPCENSSQCPRSTCFPHGSPKCVSEKCKCDYGIN